MDFGVENLFNKYDVESVKEGSKKALYGLTASYFTIPDFLAGDGKAPWKFSPEKADRLGDFVRKKYIDAHDSGVKISGTYDSVEDAMNSSTDSLDSNESLVIEDESLFLTSSIPGTHSYWIAGGAASFVSPKLSALVLGAPVAANYGFLAAQRYDLVSDSDDNFSELMNHEVEDGSIDDIDYDEVVDVLESDRSVESLRTGFNQDLFYVELGLNDVLDELEDSDIAGLEVYGDEKDSFFVEEYMEKVFGDLGGSEEPVFVFEEQEDELYRRRLVVPETVETGLADLRSDQLIEEEYLTEPAVDITYETSNDNLPVPNEDLVELEGSELVEASYLSD